MTFGIWFGLVIVPAAILLLGFVCYTITGKQEKQQ